MTQSTAIIASIALSALLGAAVLLRPHPVAQEELARPAAIPPAILNILKSKMGHHDLQMKTLLARVVLLDDDGVARAAGAIFDEPALARPVTDDELNGLLPERFFVLQDELRRRARAVVIASSRHDRAAVTDEFAALSKTCVTCHDVYLRGTNVEAPLVGGAP